MHAFSSVKGSLRRVAIWVNALFPFLYSANYLLTGRTFVGAWWMVRDWFRYRKAEHVARSGFALSLRDAYPALHDWFERAGSVPRHYFHQDLWGARNVLESGVAEHYDIGSRLDGFVAHCLCFTRVVMLDIRRLDVPVEGLSFRRANCMNMDIPSDSIPSLSSFHAIEHFGLGRYGDPIDPMGHIKALREMQRVVAVGGRIYLGLPVGRQRLEFNAHRVFDPVTIASLFEGLRLVEFAVIDDDDVLHRHEDPAAWRHLDFGCGLYHFEKTRPTA
jgi:hypothetical protein